MRNKPDLAKLLASSAKFNRRSGRHVKRRPNRPAAHSRRADLLPFKASGRTTQRPQARGRNTFPARSSISRCTTRQRRKKGRVNSIHRKATASFSRSRSKAPHTTRKSNGPRHGGQPLRHGKHRLDGEAGSARVLRSPLAQARGTAVRRQRTGTVALMFTATGTLASPFFSGRGGAHLERGGHGAPEYPAIGHTVKNGRTSRRRGPHG